MSARGTITSHSTARRLVAATVAAATLFAAGMATAAGAPGTASQVAAAVAKAPSLRVLPANLTPSLQSAATDTALVATPSVAFCDGGGPQQYCGGFGDPKGTKTMVLVGDSHAFMWFPAVNAIAKAARWRLYFLSLYGCPVAGLDVWYVKIKADYTACSAWRPKVIARIDRLNPNLVIVAETHYTRDGADKPITNAQFQSGLVRSLNALRSSRMHKVLLGDTVAIANPVECLAANPTAIQRCSASATNPTEVAQRAVDVAAARATRTLYVNELPWTCTKVCTEVIANMVVYYYSQHFTATYAAYLSGVLRQAIAADLR